MSSATETKVAHWCGWCREHSTDAVAADLSAVTHCYFLTDEAVIWLNPNGGPQLHIHDAVITTRDALTVRASVRRYARKRWLRATLPIRRRRA